MNGIVVVKKEKGFSSFDVVRKVSKMLGEKKVGHTGTLDPLATGVLVLALGRATKIIPYLDKEEKEYIAKVKIGIKTDTLDVTGTVLEKREETMPEERKIKEVLESFQKTYLQEVPMYSAIHVNGKRLYQYARENKKVELPKKKVTIKEIELLNVSFDTFTFRTVVSKGTYIRSLIRDIGEALGILCTMQELTRTRVGQFSLKDSNLLEELKEESIVSIAEALSFLSKRVVSEEEKKKIQNGCKLPRKEEEEILFLDQEGNALAIYQKDQENPAILRVKTML